MIYLSSLEKSTIRYGNYHRFGNGNVLFSIILKHSFEKLGKIVPYLSLDDKFRS